MKNYRNRPFFRALQNYVTFFLLVAFVVTCSTMLFTSVIRDSMGLVFTKENIATAAKLNFLNVVLISLATSTIDYIRRKQMVDKPVKQIMDALKEQQGRDGLNVLCKMHVQLPRQYLLLFLSGNSIL